MSRRRSCGEVRLLYRLTQTDASAGRRSRGDAATADDLNVVLKAKGDHAVDASGKAMTCAEIARRWLAAAERHRDRRRAGEKLLMAKGGAARAHRAGKHP